jgi:DNA-directed RNA polymerase subunit RPC12/RpoP
MATNSNSNAEHRKITCPYCGSSETELLSLFGQQLLTVQYYCQTCHTPFEYIKDDVAGDQEVTHITSQRPIIPTRIQKRHFRA